MLDGAEALCCELEETRVVVKRRVQRVVLGGCDRRFVNKQCVRMVGVWRERARVAVIQGDWYWYSTIR